MSKEDLERFVQITVGFAIAVLALLVWRFDEMRVGVHTIDRVETAISVTFFFWLFFAKWGWKVWPMSLLFSRPDVGGTWIGHLESDWQIGSNTPTRIVPIVFAI